jgi:hypothetical protein
VSVADDHLDQARRNRDLAEEPLAHSSADATHVQWAVTAAFYSALHCMQRYLIPRGRDPQSHAARGNDIADLANGVPMDVQWAYVRLEQLSRKVRHRLGAFAPSFVRQRVLDDLLETITDFVNL